MATKADMLSVKPFSKAASQPAKENMKNFTSPGRQRNTGNSGVLVWVMMALLVMTANLSRAQATIPSGNFQFITDINSVSDSDVFSPEDSGGSVDPSLEGCDVTVVRTDGSSGRVLVPVQSIATTNVLVLDIFLSSTTNSVSLIGESISGVGSTETNTLVFDDYQMSASLLMNQNQYSPVPQYLEGTPSPETNSTGVVGTGIIITNIVISMSYNLLPPSLDSLESPDLMEPELGLITNQFVNVLPSEDFVPPGITSLFVNSVLNLERSTFRIDKDNYTNAVIYVNRIGGDPSQSVTVNYETDPVSIDHLAQTGYSGNGPPYNTFPLEPGSDYAVPGVDYVNVSGVLSWGANDYNPKAINIPIMNDGKVDFNKDVQIVLWIPAGSTEKAVVGSVDAANLTILSDSFIPGLQPAGAVDRTWNPDNSDGSQSSPPYLQFPGTDGGEVGTANGNGGTVYSVVEQPNGEAIIAGSFNSFDSNPYNHIVRLMTNGFQDPTFLAYPNSGANDVIDAMALQPSGQIIIAGNFTSFNGTSRNRIARLNNDGSLDNTFNPGVGINGQVLCVALEANGQIIVAGDFTSVNGTNMNSVARLNADGSVDASFNPGLGPNGVVNAVTVDAEGRVIIGGAFDTVDGSNYGGVARLNTDGSLDTTFASGVGTYNPNTAATDPVYSLAMQGDQILVGGGFAYVDLVNYAGLARLNPDGTLDTTFNAVPGTDNGTYNPQTGQADSVFAITIQPDGKILIGGEFTTYNQTRRVGIARLFNDGSLDTSFMDTAYNQFAGLINHYHNPEAVNTNDYPQGNQRNYVCSIAVEPSGSNNVIIGGNFLRVGGGSVYHSGIDMYPISSGYYPLYPDDAGLQATFTTTNAGIFADERMDVHPRSNVARLIGGSTTGPGNLTLASSSYSVNKTAGNLYVTIIRTNGNLGVVDAQCSPILAANPGSGIATTNDISGSSLITEWPTIWSIIPSKSPTVAPGFFGINSSYDVQYGTQTEPHGPPDVFMSVINDTNITGNLSAKIQLSNPDGSLFELGGEPIPLGTALGSQSLSPLSILDTVGTPGVISFSSATYVVNQGGTATITVTRTNGSGAVQINYLATNGTAVSPGNYTSVSGILKFASSATSATFTVPTTSGTTAQPDKTVNLILSNPTGGATIGQTNAVLTIVNDNVNGHLAFSAPIYTYDENGGAAAISIQRLGGSVGTLNATLIVGGGTAVNGVNYVGFTTNLTWNNTDVSIHTISVPLIDDGVFNTNLTVDLQLTNGLLNTQPNANVLGLSSDTNSTLVINNIEFPGTVEFNSSVYSVKKFAGYALIPVIRTGGSAGTLTVDFSTADGTATNTVAYSATNGVLTFTNGQVAQYFSVPIIDNGQPSGLTTLNLILTNATVVNAPVPWDAQGSPSNAVLNIVDTDSVNEPPGNTDTTYDPSVGFNGEVNALALQTNNQLIVGGDFTSADGVPRQRIARLNPDGSLDAGFSLPTSTYGAGSQVDALAIQADGRIVVGGAFTNFNGVIQNYITRLNYDGSLDSTFNSGSGADSPVYALAQSPIDGKVLVGGTFARLGGITYNGIGRLNANGTPDATFNPGGLGAGSSGNSSTVYALAVQADGKIIIGGDFITYNGVTVNHLARLNTDGSLDTNFVTGIGASDSVRAIAIQLDGDILIGGLFTNYDGVALNYIARLTPSGAVDSTFTPGVGANGPVSSIALQADGRIVLGGQFTMCNGVTRGRITRLNPDGTVDPTINFGTGANGQVTALVVQEDSVEGTTNVPDEKIILGGSFSQYNGQAVDNLTRIFGGSQDGVGAFEFTAPYYQVDEDGVSAYITILRTGGTSGTNADGSGTIYVPFSTSNGTAKSGVNYQTVVTNLPFPAGEIQETVQVPVMDDHVITPDLTVNLALNPVAPAQYGNQPIATLTIVNDDSAISFSSSSYQVPQNVINNVAVIPLVRLGGTNNTAYVNFFTITNGTAIPGKDYTPVPNSVVTFAPGVTNVNVTVPVLNNPTPQGNVTLGLIVSNAVNAALYAPSNATLTIIDTATSPGELLFTATNFTANESAGTAAITVIRTNGTSGSVSVAYATSAGTAQPGLNYVQSTGTLTFINGQTIGTINIPLVQNNLVQGPVNFSVALSNPTGGATLLAPTNTAVTILSDNFGVAFLSATNYISETNIFANLLVQRIGSANLSFQVDYATTPGTAVAGVNYKATSGTLSFASGQTLQTISVPLINNLDTSNLTFGVSLSNPSSGALIGSPSNNVVILQPSQAGLSFTSSTNAVPKNQNSIVIAVVCSNPSIEPVPTTNVPPLTVRFGTADGTAAAGIDYVATNGILIFTNGVATNYFAVPIINNSLVEGNRTFTVNLSQPTAPGKLSAPSTQTITILDDNAGFSFSSANYSVSKTGGTAVITILRSGNTNTTSSVNFATADGTAVAGVNYIPTNGVINFTNGQLSTALPITIIGSAGVQPDKTVLLQLTSPTNGYLVAPSAATLTIYDDSGSLVVPAGSSLVSESISPPNGIIDPNETVTMLFAFRASGGTNINNVTATLVANSGVTSPSGPQSYGNLTVNGPLSFRPFSFTARGTNGQQIVATFQLNSGANNNIGTALFTYTLGTWTTTFYNTNPIVITAGNLASPYPSIINVTNVGGDIIKTTLTLTNMTLSAPQDIDVLLVSPAQQDTLVMANDGGQISIKNVTLTFDDAALTNLTKMGQVVSGTNKPSAFLPIPNFP